MSNVLDHTGPRRRESPEGRAPCWRVFRASKWVCGCWMVAVAIEKVHDLDTLRRWFNCLPAFSTCEEIGRPAVLRQGRADLECLNPALSEKEGVQSNQVAGLSGLRHGYPNRTFERCNTNGRSKVIARFGTGVAVHDVALGSPRARSKRSADTRPVDRSRARADRRPVGAEPAARVPRVRRQATAGCAAGYRV